MRFSGEGRDRLFPRTYLEEKIILNHLVVGSIPTTVYEQNKLLIYVTKSHKKIKYFHRKLKKKKKKSAEL